MTVLLVAGGLSLIALPGLQSLPSRQLAPHEWAAVAAMSLRLGVAATQLGLFLGAAPTVLRAARVEHVAAACHRMFGPVAPGGAAAGWLSAGLLGWVVVRRRLAARRSRRAVLRLRVEPWLGEHQTRDGIDIVTLPTREPLAYVVAGTSPQVVLSEGLADSLTAAERAAVFRHELSHLRHGHHRLLAVAGGVDAAFGTWGAARRSAADLRLALERWADEEAATPAGRHVVRDALAKTTATMLGPVPAFTAACTIIDRLAALELDAPQPARSTRAAAVAPVIVLACLVGVVLVVSTAYIHHGPLGIVGFCPL